MSYFLGYLLFGFLLYFLGTQAMIKEKKSMEYKDWKYDLIGIILWPLVVAASIYNDARDRKKPKK